MYYLAPDNSVMQGWLPTFDKVKDDFSLLGLPIISCLDKKPFQISLLPETLRKKTLMNLQYQVSNLWSEAANTWAIVLLVIELEVEGGFKMLLELWAHKAL